MKKYAVTEIPNVKETLNLTPPEWYDAIKGGYLYLWTNLTNFKYNLTITDHSKKKQVFYFGLGSKGKLGYIDGSYYESCQGEQWKLDKDDPNIEWKFEVVEFLKEYEMAEYQESFHLQDIGAEQSKEYYNGNNGFKEIKESKVQDILKLIQDQKDASSHFMSLDPKDREGFYNGFQYRVLTIDEIADLIPYQLPQRQEAEDVIDSIADMVRKKHGDTTTIDPISVMHLDSGILEDDNGDDLEGDLNYAGNHRKKGAEAGGASRMGVLFTPKARTAGFGELEIQQLAAADNPQPTKPRNPTGIQEYVDIVRKMVSQKKIPLTHPDIHTYLDSCNVKSKVEKKIISLAKEQNKHAANNTTPIRWNIKGWAAEGAKIKNFYTTDTSRASVCSVETFNIEMFMNVRDKANKDHNPITDFYFLMYGKNQFAWDMWDFQPKGRANANTLVANARNEIYDIDDNVISNIKVHFIRLPRKHSNVGVNNKNFWKSRFGKDFLDDQGITLEDEESK